jgi:hypothetical protein
MRKTQHQPRVELEAYFGGLANAIDLRGIDRGDLFPAGALVNAIRDNDLVIAFHAVTPEWWWIKGKDLVEEVVRTGRPRELRRAPAILIGNIETAELLTAAVHLWEQGEWPDELGMSEFFIEKLAELSDDRGELH